MAHLRTPEGLEIGILPLLELECAPRVERQEGHARRGFREPRKGSGNASKTTSPSPAPAYDVNHRCRSSGTAGPPRRKCAIAPSQYRQIRSRALEGTLGP